MITALKYCERALILSGVGLLGVYAFFWTHAVFFQAYDSWAFDQDLKHTTHELDPRSSTVDSSEILKGKEEVPDQRDWAPGRALAYEKSLARQPQRIVGRLLIPVLNLNVMVLEGTDRWTLNRAAGHIESTALPGTSGNVGISAHRDGFFRNLNRINKGDEISFVTMNGTYTYQVNSTRVVKPEDLDVLAPSVNPVLTLVTCYPFYVVGAAPQRFIVQAQLIH